MTWTQRTVDSETVMTDAAATEPAEPNGARPDNVVPLAKPAQDHDPLLRDLFGRVIRQARHDQGRTLVDVAGRAGVSVPYLSEMERGRKEPSSEMLAAVCEALGLDLLDLVSRTYVDLVAGRAAQAEAEPRRVPVSLRSARAHRVGGSGSADVLALAA
ncbi:MAG TPA: helix-turn-helix transcriptional regulator [Microlunatus sp.]